MAFPSKKSAKKGSPKTDKFKQTMAQKNTPPMPMNPMMGGMMAPPPVKKGK